MELWESQNFKQVERVARHLYGTSLPSEEDILQGLEDARRAVLLEAELAICGPVVSAIILHDEDELNRLFAAGGSLDADSTEARHLLEVFARQPKTFNAVFPDAATFQLAVGFGFDPNSALSTRWSITQDESLLHTAVRRGDLDLVEILLDAGADIESRVQSTGSTPLELALKRWRSGRRRHGKKVQTEMAALLVSRGADYETPMIRRLTRAGVAQAAKRSAAIAHGLQLLYSSSSSEGEP